MSTDDRACAATLSAELERQIMSCNEPKNEREWWACREIEKLREEIATLKQQISDHKCTLPDSIQEALNSGDGVYRP